MSEYIFKLKKGDLELELKSDDAQFIEQQMNNWRTTLLSGPSTAASAPAVAPAEVPVAPMTAPAPAEPVLEGALG